MIPDDKVREVRERASIVEIISDYMSLKKSGANYQGLCPFHGEKTPSFNVNPARGIFHCFGCGVGGNVVTFVMRMEGMTFPAAVKFLAKRVGVEIPERPLSREEKHHLDEQEQMYAINEMASDFYRRTLESEAGGAGRNYLARRGVDAQTAATYRMGFAPEGWDHLAKHLQRKGISPQLAEKMGLLRKREGRDGYYDTFRNRLLFTISDLHGRAIGFGGRVMDDSLPKYINSPESPIYRKSEVLFGLDLAKKGMREQGSVIIVEGYFDHLALYRAGYTNVVATCGTALTPQHLDLLKRYAERAYMLFDADLAGRKAMARSFELFLEHGFPARVVEVPAGDDPDTFINREGGEAFAPLLTASLPIFEFVYRGMLRKTDTTLVEWKVSFINKVNPWLMKIKDPVERAHYEEKISQLTGHDIRRFQNPGKAPAAAQPAPRPQAATSGRAGTEEVLLTLMAKFPEVVFKVREQGVDTLFSPGYRELARAIIEQSQSGGVDLSSILDLVESPEERSRLLGLFVDDASLQEMDPIKGYEQCHKALQRGALKRGKSLTRELARLDQLTDPESPEYREVLLKLEALRNKKSKLS